jgi:hypothetical protein
MRTSSAVKPENSITAENHFHVARNSLKLHDSSDNYLDARRGDQGGK